MKRELRKPAIIIGILFTVLSLFSQGLAQMEKSRFEVQSIIELTPRQIESLDVFYITGKVGKSLSLGIKWFTLCDIKNEDQYVQVTTVRESLPMSGTVITLKVKLYQQISFNNHITIVLIETK